MPISVYMNPNSPVKNLKLWFAGDLSLYHKLANFIPRRGSLGLGKTIWTCGFSHSGFTNLLIPQSPSITKTMSEVPRIINYDFHGHSPQSSDWCLVLGKGKGLFRLPLLWSCTHSCPMLGLHSTWPPNSRSHPREKGSTFHGQNISIWEPQLWWEVTAVQVGGYCWRWGPEAQQWPSPLTDILLNQNFL